MQVYYIFPSLIFSAGLFILLYLEGPENDQIHRPGGPLYLSSYIKQGNIEEGRLAARVGQPFDVFAEANYAGYFTVDETTDSNIFFWFFVAENDPLSSPLILWLNGGPGCSSLMALFNGAGPFSTDNAAKTLISNPYSWHQNHNILFFDQPVHTGFSFANSSYYVQYSDEAAIHMYSALTQFFQIFTEYKETSFFIAGESYAGKYVPAIAIHIHRMNQQISNNKINLKGIAIGNGIVDPFIQADFLDLVFEAGLIDITTKMSFQKQQYEFFKNHLKSPALIIDNSTIDNLKDCNTIQIRDYYEKIYYTYNCNENDYENKQCGHIKLLMDVFKYKVLKGYNEQEGIIRKIRHKTEPVNKYNFLQESNTDGMQFGHFLNNPNNKYFIHALDKLYPMKYNMLPCSNEVLKHMTKDNLISMKHYLEELLENYKILLYSGQLDIVVSYPTSVNLIYHLNWTGSENYKLAKRKLWKVDGKTVGYIKTVQNFSEVLIRNAGHMVIQDQPYLAKILFTNFTRNTLL